MRPLPSQYTCRNPQQGFAQVNGVTQARSLEDADEMARDLVSILTDEVPESFDITLEVNLPEKTAEARQIAEELREGRTVRR